MSALTHSQSPVYDRKSQASGIRAVEIAKAEGVYNQAVKQQPVKTIHEDRWKVLFSGVKVLDVQTPSWISKERNTFKAQVVRTKRTQAIHIFGSYSGKSFDRVFSLGDYVEIDAYNLIYFGKIASITEKTVSVKTDSGKTKRLPLPKFIDMNATFSFAEAKRQNHLTSYSI